MAETERNTSNVQAVECFGICKAYGTAEVRTEVLKGVNFAARPGEITFVMGPSGCGKTTLLSIISGILSADDGSVRVFGRELSDLRNAELARFRRQNIGFVLQQFNLLPTLDLVENVAVPLVVQGVRGSVAHAAAADVLTTLGLERELRKHPTEISVGQQQRTAIARALVHNPRLIVCDEPTSALDAVAGRSIMLLLKEHALTTERAIVVVTHDDRITPFADRTAYLTDGLVTRIRTRNAAKEMI